MAYDVTLDPQTQPKPTFAIRKQINGGAGESNEPCGFWRGIWWAMIARVPQGETWCLILLRSNVEVHLRRTLCDVRWNVLLAPIIHRLFPASAQNRFRAVVAVRIAPVEGPLVVQLPYILSQR